MEYLVVSENKEALKKKMKGTGANLKEIPVVKSEAIWTTKQPQYWIITITHRTE